MRMPAGANFFSARGFSASGLKNLGITSAGQRNIFPAKIQVANAVLARGLPLADPFIPAKLVFSHNMFAEFKKVAEHRRNLDRVDHVFHIFKILILSGSAFQGHIATF